MLSIRIRENPMPSGSRDRDVLLNWILESMGLIKRRTNQWGDDFQHDALHKLLSNTFLKDPLKGWNNADLGNQCGLSHTGIHHQITKLRTAGLISTEIDGKWHIHVLRGGSITSAIRLVTSQARIILQIRLSELSELIHNSQIRMKITPEDENINFTINIAEHTPRRKNRDKIDSLVSSLGLDGERNRTDDNLSRKILCFLCENENPVTILYLVDKFGGTRSRVQRIVDRMRHAGLIERVPMIDRIAQDIFSSIIRQYEGRGEEWLISTGGLGRLEESKMKLLIKNTVKGTLNISKVQEILSEVPIPDQKILINTLGGRMPYGIRISGIDGQELSENVLRKADRTFRRILTVSELLDEVLIS